VRDCLEPCDGVFVLYSEIVSAFENYQFLSTNVKKGVHSITLIVSEGFREFVIGKGKFVDVYKARKIVGGRDNQVYHNIKLTSKKQHISDNGRNLLKKVNGGDVSKLPSDGGITGRNQQLRIEHLNLFSGFVKDCLKSDRNDGVITVSEMVDAFVEYSRRKPITFQLNLPNIKGAVKVGVPKFVLGHPDKFPGFGLIYRNNKKTCSNIAFKNQKLIDGESRTSSGGFNEIEDETERKSVNSAQSEKNRNSLIDYVRRFAERDLIPSLGEVVYFSEIFEAFTKYVQKYMNLEEYEFSVKTTVARELTKIFKEHDNFQDVRRGFSRGTYFANLKLNEIDLAQPKTGKRKQLKTKTDGNEGGVERGDISVPTQSSGGISRHFRDEDELDMFEFDFDDDDDDQDIDKHLKIPFSDDDGKHGIDDDDDGEIESAVVEKKKKRKQSGGDVGLSTRSTSRKRKDEDGDVDEVRKSRTDDKKKKKISRDSDSDGDGDGGGGGDGGGDDGDGGGGDDGGDNSKNKTFRLQLLKFVDECLLFNDDDGILYLS
jgi:uncharacterized membrane protein YgcG